MSSWMGGGMAAATHVGQLIDLPFLPSPIPRGFALWDGEVHAIADYPRLFAKIGQTFKLVGDTYNEATHFRFGGGAVFRKGATYTPPAPPVGCAYPLDASVAELASLGLGGKLSMDATQQVGTYTVQGGLGATANYGAGPTGLPATNATLDFATGKRTEQTVLQVPTITGGAGAQAVLAQITLYNFGIGQIAAQAILAARDDGTFTLQIADAAGTAYGAVIGAGSAVVTFEMDATAGTYNVRVDGTVQVAARAYTPAGLTLIEQVIEYVGVAPAFAALTASVTARTAWADIVGPVSAGFADSCGLTGGGGGGGGGYAFGRFGSDTTDAHALTKAELPVQAHVEGLMDPANYAKTVYTVEASTLPADGHSHAVNPTHDAQITLVRI